MECLATVLVWRAQSEQCSMVPRPNHHSHSREFQLLCCLTLEPCISVLEIDCRRAITTLCICWAAQCGAAKSARTLCSATQTAPRPTSSKTCQVRFRMRAAFVCSLIFASIQIGFRTHRKPTRRSHIKTTTLSTPRAKATRLRLLNTTVSQSSLTLICQFTVLRSA